MKLNFQSVKKAFIIVPALAIFSIGCDKDDNDDMTKNETITDVVVASDNFSTLETAVLKAELQTTLSGPGPFTVFAPDNAAFAASGITSAAINGLTKQQTSAILLYHTLGAKVMAANVPAGPNQKVVTASGDSVFVTSNGSGVFVNGVKVEQADIGASNGVIHRIGRVLIPPVGNIVATAQAPGSGLDSLVKAVLRATNGPGGNPNLASTLGAARLTVFAPTNAAFTQLLGALGLDDINDIPVATLLAVLQYHVVPGRVFSSDLSSGTVAMLAGGNTTIGLSDGLNSGPSITGNGNGGNKSNIVGANIVATNGVVHVIDRVLLP
jgi:uncharacterized surface protein with fasciclin (FAS1) repeats